MISFRQSDLLEQLQPKDIYVGIDMDFIVDEHPNKNFSATNHYTVPTVFEPMTTANKFLQDEVNDMLMQSWGSDPILVAWETITNNAEYNELKEVSEKDLHQYLPKIKGQVESFLKSKGIDILSSQYVSESLAVAFKIQ